MPPHILVVGDVLDRLEVSTVAGAESSGAAMPASIQRRPAGRAADTAAWLGVTNCPVTFFGRVGEGDGDRHRRELAKHGVEAVLAEDADHHTGLSVDVDGQRYDDPGAAAHLTGADIPGALWDQVAWFHVTAELLARDSTRDTAMALLAEARERGIGTSIDPGSAALLRTVGVEVFREWTHGIDLIFLDLDEARLLVGATGPFIDFDILTQVYPHAAVTLGSMGAAYVSAEHREQVAAPRIEIVDHQGAGAAFVAGFLSRWSGQRDPHAALTAGIALAQRCLHEPGSRP